jgi:hypothetical protein
VDERFLKSSRRVRSVLNARPSTLTSRNVGERGRSPIPALQETELCRASRRSYPAPRPRYRQSALAGALASTGKVFGCGSRYVAQTNMWCRRRESTC